MKVSYHVIKDVKLDGRVESDEDIAATSSDEERRLRYSITSLCYPGDGKLYCGVTNFVGDILQEFDLAGGTFRSLGFTELADPNDHKIHKGLWYDGQKNSLFFGIASLSPLPKMLGKGGRLFRYDIAAESYEQLGVPKPDCYIQATSYDPKRQIMTVFTEPDHSFTVFELDGRKVRRSVAVGSIVHIPGIDPAGGVWGTHSNQHAFFRYNPDTDTMEFPQGCRMPTAQQARNLMYDGAGPVDCALTGPDGQLYVASAMGEVYRINPESGELAYIARPVPHTRLPAMVFGPDGRLYGIGGDKYSNALWALDVDTARTEVIGKVETEDGLTLFRPHDMVCIDGVFYIGETDNPDRSGYLWQCEV